MVLLMSFVVVCGGLLFALGSASDLSENSLAVLNARAFSDMIHYNVGFEKRNVYLNGGYIYVGIKLYVGVCVSAFDHPCADGSFAWLLSGMSS